jgi:hypothetical protein
MWLAPNVIAHDPETDLSKITPERLLAHGWPDAAIKILQQRNNRLNDLESRTQGLESARVPQSD